MVLNWKQAQEAAREWFKTAFFQATGERVRTGVYTVAHAMEDYLDDRDRHGMTTVERVRKDFEAHVLPYLAGDAVEHLTRKRVEDWMKLVAESGLRRRGKPRAAPVTPDQKRSRKSTANLRIELQVLDLPRGLKAERHGEEGCHVHGFIFLETRVMGHRHHGLLLPVKPFLPSNSAQCPAGQAFLLGVGNPIEGIHPYETATGRKLEPLRQ
jgi:hypothetical protein